MTAFPTLLSPIRLGGVEIRNRVCLTGHGTGMPVDGTPNDRLIRYYEERARGEVGLIMLGSQQVHPSSPGITGLLTNYDDRIIPGLARLARRVQAQGARVFGYLSHMGFATSARPVPLWSASAGYEAKFGEVAHAMTGAEIALIVEAHAAAAARNIEAGLDGIELHCGHGLLVQQFLSPLSNRRQDGYGGSLRNRARFALEIVAAVRDRIGPQVPLGVRLSGDELVPGGLGIEEMTEVAGWLVAAGQLDYVDVSAGSDGDLVSNMLHEPPMGLPPGPFRSLARRIRETVGVPVIHGTRVHTAEFAEAMLAEGDADMAGMARALIADPHLPRKARLGAAARITPCIACEQACFGRLFRGGGISCIATPATGREAELLDAVTPAAEPLHVLVVGGGPAGMEAALSVAARGHRVTLAEAGASLGGRLDLARRPAGRGEWARLAAFKIAELQREGVALRTGLTVTADVITHLAPDRVILASGAVPRPFDLPGLDPAQVLTLDDAVRDWSEGGGRLGYRVVVIDALHRAPAFATAISLAQAGHAVALVSAALHVGQNLEIQNLTRFTAEAQRAGVRLLPMLRPVRVEEGQLVLDSIFTREEAMRLEFDTLVAALPGLPCADLAEECARLGLPCEVIGDAYAPRDVEAAILDGRMAGMRA